MAGGSKRQRPGKEHASTPSTYPYKDGSYLWFESKEELTHFKTLFEKRDILPVRFITHHYLTHKGYEELIQAFNQGHWYDFLAKPINAINEPLIRAFYSNLRQTEAEEAYTSVNGHQILLSTENVHTMTGLSYRATPQSHYHEAEFINQIGIHYNTAGVLTTADMPQQFRLLFYIITRIIKPRKSSHTIITHEDLVLMHHILNNVTFNFCDFIIRQMVDATAQDKPLPFAPLVMAILENEGIDVKAGPQLKMRKDWNINDVTFKIPRNPNPRGTPPSSTKPTLKGIAASIDALSIELRSTQVDIQRLNRRMTKHFGLEEEEEAHHDDEED